jgi:prepilin-type N-terminal cleavage/methylation domain-containing protein
MGRRRAVTLIELLVTLSILAILIGLILSGISKVRSAAVKSESENNLRQISLAFHTKIAQKNQLTDLPTSSLSQTTSGLSFFENLLQVLMPERRVPVGADYNAGAWDSYNNAIVKIYKSPGDFTLALRPSTLENYNRQISYTCNMLVFDKAVSYPQSIPDGTSQTISICEKYWFNEFEIADARNGEKVSIPCSLDWANMQDSSRGSFYGRRATFADKSSFDIHPISDGKSQSVGSPKIFPSPLAQNRPFAYRPPVLESWCDRPQTPHSAGLPILLLDGSVRTLHPNIDERVFWGLVTPAGGEVVGDF